MKRYLRHLCHCYLQGDILHIQKKNVGRLGRERDIFLLDIHSQLQQGLGLGAGHSRHYNRVFDQFLANLSITTNQCRDVGTHL